MFFEHKAVGDALDVQCSDTRRDDIQAKKIMKPVSTHDNGAVAGLDMRTITTDVGKIDMQGRVSTAASGVPWQ